ncbi:MAG TPA: hypothetical protein VHA52_11585 [Candidatus Babeliaceae bacterium]|nr:hypothetical protein [Candidatus Babeliaceae bacterium]
MPGIKGFDEIEAELARHPGKIAHDEWRNLARIFYDIYQKNRKELVERLEEPSKNDKLSTELFQNVRPQTVKEAYTNEVLRSLFNYLSSLSSLVDTGMRLVGKYSSEQMAEYDKPKTLLINSDVNSFFGKLRNYIQHYGIPPLGWEIRLNNNSFNSCTYFLSKDKLLAWDGWNAKAKAYIGDQNVNLLESVQAHGDMVDKAYHALLSLFPIIHSADTAAYNELMHRRNDILSGKIKL